MCSVKQEASFMTVAKECVNYVVIFLFRVSSYEWYLLIKGNLLFSNFANTPSYIYTNVPAIFVVYPKYQKKNGSNKKLVDQPSYEECQRRYHKVKDDDQNKDSEETAKGTHKPMQIDLVFKQIILNTPIL